MLEVVVDSPSVNESVELLLADIDPDDTYRFRVFIEVKALAADLAANGQDFPVVVRPMGERWQLVCGFRRVAALRELGAATVRAVVRDLDDQAALRLAWSENESRRSYSDVDRAHAVVKCSLEGYSLRDLEEVFDLKKSQLGKLRILGTMPAVVKEAVEAGQLTSTMAVALNKLKRTYPQLDYRRWVTRVAAEGWDLRQLKQRVGLAYDPPRVEAVTRDPGSGKVRLRARTFVPAEMDPEDRALLIAELRLALKALEEV